MLEIEQKHRLRKTFALVEGQAQIAALVFYQRLFELDPRLRALFKNDIEQQAAKLMEMLATTLSLLEKRDELTEVLENLGARHVEYGVRTEHYATVGEALLSMLSSVLGSQFCPQTRQAWAELYQFIAATMLRGAAH